MLTLSSSPSFCAISLMVILSVQKDYPNSNLDQEDVAPLRCSRETTPITIKCACNPFSLVSLKKCSLKEESRVNGCIQKLVAAFAG